METRKLYEEIKENDLVIYYSHLLKNSATWFSNNVFLPHFGYFEYSISSGNNKIP